MKVRQKIRGGPQGQLLTYHGLLNSFRQTKRLVIDEQKYTLEQINYRPPRGGNGFVLWAIEDDTGDKCAIKFFSRPNAKKMDRDRFISEAKTLRKLSHPRVVRCLAAGFVEVSSNLVSCFVMPRARCSMADLIASKELRKDLPFTLRFFSALGQGLAYLHDMGIFHRDLKEGNILVDDENLPWIADLGIARIPQSLSPDAVKTNAGERLRNALYSSPEQNITGSEVTRTADIASFGYMLNHWLTDEPARPNTLLPSDFLETQNIVALDAVIEQCTARNPEQRYQNMRTCLSDLAIALGTTCESKYRLGALGTARRQIRALSRGWPQPDLLSADNLRALYLGREKFSPDLKELRLLMRHLLTRGSGKHLRLNTPDAEATAGLGWYWLRECSQESFARVARDATSAKQVSVRQGAARVLSALGGPDDLAALWTLAADKLTIVAAEAVRSIGILGSEHDVDRLRDLLSSEAPGIREAVVGILQKRGTTCDLERVVTLLNDPDPNVKRSAVWALKSLAAPEDAKKLLEALVTEYGMLPEADQRRFIQSKSAALRALRQIAGDERSFGLRGVALQVADAAKWFDKLMPSEKHEQLYSRVPKNQMAACKWYKEKENHKVIEALLHEEGRELPFVILQQFDEHLYAPNWWHNASVELDSTLEVEG